MGREQFLAAVASTNTLSFIFRYQGSQHGTLTIRKAAQWGTNVMVSVEHGQFVCGIRGFAVNVRFDGGPIQPFGGTEPADHSTTTLFLDDEASFISQLDKAKLVRAEATFYNQGLLVLEFKKASEGVCGWAQWALALMVFNSLTCWCG